MQVTTGKLGYKGHVVMPQTVREMLGIDKGATIAWVITDDKRIEIRKISTQTLQQQDDQEFKDMLQTLGMSEDEWKAERKNFAQEWMQQNHPTLT